MTTGVLDIAQLEFSFNVPAAIYVRGSLSISKIIGRLSPYWKIIGGFQNNNNLYRLWVLLEISDKIVDDFSAQYFTALCTTIHV
jgi:hypothetical protein